MISTDVDPTMSASAENLAWYGPGTATPQLLTFMRAVYRRHVARSTGSFVDILPESALSPIEDGHRAQAAAARPAIRLLGAARADLRAARRDGRERIGITGAYRSARRQFEIWQGKGAGGRRGFPFYYHSTENTRRRFGDPHGPDAAAYLASVMAERFAAPGYSSHQAGLAVDFGTSRVGARRLRTIGARDWFHGWLLDHAGDFGYEPSTKEPWHWVHRPRSAMDEYRDRCSGDEEAGFDEAEGRLEYPAADVG